MSVGTWIDGFEIELDTDQDRPICRIRAEIRGYDFTGELAEASQCYALLSKVGILPIAPDTLARIAQWARARGYLNELTNGGNDD